MSYRKFQTYFFVSILTIAAIMTLLVFRPYLTLLAFGGVVAVISRPVYARLHKLLRSETSAAFLTTVVIATVVLVPMIFFFGLLSQELILAVSNIRGQFSTDDLTDALRRLLPASLQASAPDAAAEGIRMVRTVAEAMSQDLLGMFSNLFQILFGAVVVMISSYYLLKDGAKIKAQALAISPLGDEYDELVFRRVITAVSAVMNGFLIVSLIKGILSGFFFWVFGVSAPLFWGAMAGFASLIPFFGSGLVTIPAVAYLFVTGHVVAAVGLAVVSLFLIGLIDNVLQPMFVQRKTQIHPLLILLSILGGLSFYGFSGFILGPLTLAVLMALLDIYQKEFRQFVEKVAKEEG